MSENKNVAVMHGCSVCAKTYNVMPSMPPADRRVDCTVTSFGGHRGPDEQHLLVACDTHTAEDIEAAHQRWQARNATEIYDDEQSDEKKAPNGL
jgi:hypothetical protein